MKTGYATRGEVEALASDVGEVVGGLKYELDTMASVYVEIGARIASLETRVAALTAAPPQKAAQPAK